MVKEGIPFIVIPAIGVVLLAFFGIWIAVVALVLITAFMMYFFRDPERTIPTEPGIVVSAADGRVTRIDRLETGTVVSVFLSPLDVHINRSPIAGKITAINYTKGRKMPATNDAASIENERNSLVIEGADLKVTCTQIAGIVARRIVCWPKAGDNLERGQRFGLIKFSSRTDLQLPPEMEICVSVGDKVVGGESIIARSNSLPSS